MGPFIQVNQDDDPAPDSEDFSKAAVGKFKDARDFTEEEIQFWVDHFWLSRGYIKVKKSVENIFFFFCDVEEDKMQL